MTIPSDDFKSLERELKEFILASNLVPPLIYGVKKNLLLEHMKKIEARLDNDNDRNKYAELLYEYAVVANRTKGNINHPNASRNYDNAQNLFQKASESVVPNNKHAVKLKADILMDQGDFYLDIAKQKPNSLLEPYKKTPEEIRAIYSNAADLGDKLSDKEKLKIAVRTIPGILKTQTIITSEHAVSASPSRPIQRFSAERTPPINNQIHKIKIKDWEVEKDSLNKNITKFVNAIDKEKHIYVDKIANKVSSNSTSIDSYKAMIKAFQDLYGATTQPIITLSGSANTPESRKNCETALKAAGYQDIQIKNIMKPIPASPLPSATAPKAEETSHSPSHLRRK